MEHLLPQDIQTLYQDSGFLFSSVNAVETKVVNDSITVEIRIREDEKATIGKVSVVGMTKPTTELSSGTPRETWRFI